MTRFTAAKVALSRAFDVVLRARRERRLREEIDLHLQLLTSDYLAKGLTPEEAHRAARRAFGRVDHLEMLHRDQRGLPLLDAFRQDVAFAVRLLSRDRAFAVTAMLVLGIGIGVNNMFFTILNAHTIRGLPIVKGHGVVYVSTVDERNRDRGISFPEFIDLRSGAASFAAVSAFMTAPAIVAGDGHAADRFTATFVSANAFDLIGVHPVIGRGFIPEDDQPESAPVVMLGNGAWQDRYGGDAAILGRPILVNNTPTTVVGVVPDRSGFPTTADIWLPVRFAPGFAAADREVRNLRVLGRVHDDALPAKAAAEVHTILDRPAGADPAAGGIVRARVVPADEQYFGRLDDPAWRAFIAAGFLVVLISCANVANLMLAHSTGRAREFGIRTSLGATRRRILQQILIEGVVLAAAGATIGFGVSLASVRLFRGAMPQNALPYWIDYSVDARVMAALGAVSLLAVLLFALLPALHASKTDVNAILKEGGRLGTGRRGRRWTTVFLTAEFALAVVLLSQVVVSIRDAGPPLPSDRALDTRSVITATITLPDAGKAPEDRIRRYQSLNERIRALPGVSSASMASALPLTGGAEATLSVRGESPSSGEGLGTVRTVLIGPGFFETVGVPLMQGRDFSERDGGAASPVGIVNERLANKFFPGANPIGQRVALANDQTSVPAAAVTIVGVAADIRQRPSSDPDPVVYLSYKTAPPPTLALLLRTTTDPGGLVPLLRDAVMRVDPNLPVYRIQTMAEVARDADWNRRLSRVLVLFITAIAVALSTVGLYAVTAHGVTQRRQEIGVRMALGAGPSAVVYIVARRVLIQLAFGFVAGIACTFVWQRMFGSAGADAEAVHPGSLVAVATILAVAAVIACFVPARRASHLDPVAAIRGD
jgi:predicted permease